MKVKASPIHFDLFFPQQFVSEGYCVDAVIIALYSFCSKRGKQPPTKVQKF